MATDEIIVKDFSGLLDALATVRERLGISFELLDELSGLTRGHSCKVLSERSKGLGPLAFDMLLGALGLQIAIRPDLVACQKLADRWEKRAEYALRSCQPVSKRMLDRCRPIILAELGYIGEQPGQNGANGANGHAAK
jgi:hypothetical protein